LLAILRSIVKNKDKQQQYGKGHFLGLAHKFPCATVVYEGSEDVKDVPCVLTFSRFCKRVSYVIVFCLFLLICSLSYAQPLQVLGPFDISGTITDAQWRPAKDKKLMKGGALAGGSHYPAHFIVKLVKYDGVAAEDAIRITKILRSEGYDKKTYDAMPLFIIMKIHSNDRNFLKKNMRIKVTGYTLTQHERKIIDRNDGVEILGQ
jgi:hypothetical protein